jgi:hypothetical protein
LQLVLEVGFAGRRKERHGYAPFGWWGSTGRQSQVLITPSTR